PAPGREWSHARARLPPPARPPVRSTPPAPSRAGAAARATAARSRLRAAGRAGGAPRAPTRTSSPPASGAQRLRGRLVLRRLLHRLPDTPPERFQQVGQALARDRGDQERAPRLR